MSERCLQCGLPVEEHTAIWAIDHMYIYHPDIMVAQARDHKGKTYCYSVGPGDSRWGVMMHDARRNVAKWPREFASLPKPKSGEQLREEERARERQLARCAGCGLPFDKDHPDTSCWMGALPPDELRPETARQTQNWYWNKECLMRVHAAGRLLEWG